MRLHPHFGLPRSNLEVHVPGCQGLKNVTMEVFKLGDSTEDPPCHYEFSELSMEFLKEGIKLILEMDDIILNMTVCIYLGISNTRKSGGGKG